MRKRAFLEKLGPELASCRELGDYRATQDMAFEMRV